MKTITYVVSDERAEFMKKDLLRSIRCMESDLKRAELKLREAEVKTAREAANVAEWKSDMAEKMAMYESAFGPLPEPDEPKQSEKSAAVEGAVSR